MKQWSKDWANFDWNEIEERINKAVEAGESEADIGLTRDEILEFIRWTRLNAPDFYAKIVIAEVLQLEGVSEEKSAALVEMLDELKKWKS